MNIGAKYYRKDAFDVTSVKYRTVLVTEKGIISDNKDAIAAAFPERVRAT
jgi:methylthioribose-1-phosphate isomerase